MTTAFSPGLFGRPSSTSTASEEALSTAVRWLQDCANNHLACNRHGPEYSYPTRLIDVFVRSGFEDRVRLIISAEHDLHGHYITLSHCWGAAKFLKLHKNNLETLKDGIHIQELELTFQHAVEVTRRLGFKYLWIDSLCILQQKDDLEDWLRQSRLMTQVYSNAYLNLSATSSEGPTEGLFRERNPRLLHQAELEVLSDTSISGCAAGTYTLIQGYEWSRWWTDAPLHKRAWVLQERLLARRVLHFTDRELIWECHEHDATESFPNGLAKYENGLRNFKNLDPYSHKRRETFHGIRYEDIPYELWKRVQEEYSRCLLTDPNDRVIALSGIAKVFRSMMQDQYVVGMWRKHLASALLWHTTVLSPAERRSAKKGPKNVPSFSWLSVYARTLAGQISDEGMLIQVLYVHIDYVTEDTTGLVKAGSLRLKGTVKKLKLNSTTDGFEIQVRGMLAEVDPEIVFLDPHRDDLLDTMYEGKLFYLPSRCHESEHFLHSLLLEIMDPLRGTYRRVGLMRSRSLELRSLLLASHEDEATVPCLTYDAESHRHDICLV